MSDECASLFRDTTSRWMETDCLTPAGAPGPPVQPGDWKRHPVEVTGQQRPKPASTTSDSRTWGNLCLYEGIAKRESVLPCRILSESFAEHLIFLGTGFEAGVREMWAWCEILRFDSIKTLGEVWLGELGSLEASDTSMFCYFDGCVYYLYCSLIFGA